MNDLFSEPHQADECTQGAGDDEATLQTVCEEVVSAGEQKRIFKQLRKKKKKTAEIKRPWRPLTWRACPTAASGESSRSL